MPEFSGENAFRHVSELVGFGPRYVDSPASRSAQRYIIRELQKAGLSVRTDVFQDQTPVGTKTFVNIIGIISGRVRKTDSGPIVIIGTHYDTKLLPDFVGANDGGSGTGILLELARIIEPHTHAVDYWLVFFDGEEAFCNDWHQCQNGKDNTYGSRHLAGIVAAIAKGHRLNVKAVIILDLVGYRNLRLEYDATKSDPTLIRAFREQATVQGIPLLPNHSGFLDDKDPFIPYPVIDLMQYKSYPHWHKSSDTLDKISPESLQRVGRMTKAVLQRTELF